MIAENRVISGAGDEGDERLESCKIQISGKFRVTESAYYVVLYYEIDDVGISFLLSF